MSYKKPYTSSTNKYAINNITYVVPEDELKEILPLAKIYYKEEYLAFQKEELEDAQMQLEDGFIDDISEYDEGEHLAEYDENNCMDDIMAKANDMFRAKHDLPKSIIIESDAKINDYTKESMKAIANAHTKTLYGVEVEDIRQYRYATAKDQMNYKAYKDFCDMRKDASYGKFLDLCGNLNKKYSLTNLMRIFSQKKDATILNTYNAWQNYGRGVVGGAKRIEIYQPIILTFTNEKEIEDKAKASGWKKSYVDALVEKLQKSPDGKITELDGFHPVGVFDIGDTYVKDKEKDKYGKALEKMKGTTGNLTDEIKGALASVCSEYGLSKVIKDMSVTDAYEYISECADKALSLNPENIVGISTLTVYKGDRHQIEVAVAAGLIAGNIGIESKASSFEIANAFDSKELMYSDKLSVFNEMFERGYAFSKEFNEKLERQLDKTKEKQNDKEQKTI